MDNTTSTNGSRSLINFRDIMEERRKGSDIMWMTKAWTPLYACIKPLPCDPTSIKKAVLNSELVRRVVAELSSQRGLTEAELFREVQLQLTEIGHSKKMAVIRWIGLFVTKALKKTCNGLMINEKSVERFKAALGPNPVILAPSHRSYADFILMAYIFFHYCIEIPCVAAGMDFLSMWLMGHLLRDTGAFFMRRSFSGDKLYSTVFSEYVRTLVLMGNSPVEFFIEGTRSRSGKSLVPKFGFLSMVLEPFYTGKIPDVTIVPINISYDRTLEEKLFAYELLGVPKPQESTSGLLKALNMLDERYGRIHVEFGEPVSVRQYIEKQGLGRPIHATGPVSIQRTTPFEQALTRTLAHDIVRMQQRMAVISPFNVVAVILSNHLQSGRQLELVELVREVTWFVSVLETFGGVIDVRGDIETSVREALKIHRSVVSLSKEGYVMLRSVHSPSVVIDPNRMKGHQLSPDTMIRAVPLLMLQHYVNPTLHLLASPAIITAVMQQFDVNVEVTRDELFSKYTVVRQLLSYEFVMYSAWEVKDFEEALRLLDLVNIVELTSSGRYVLGNHRKLQILLCLLLDPFLLGYSHLCQSLIEAKDEPQSEKTLYTNAQYRVEDISHHPAALSLDSLSCGLQALSAMGAIRRFRRNGELVFVGNAKELESVRAQLDFLLSWTNKLAVEEQFSKSLHLDHTLPAKL